MAGDEEFPFPFPPYDVQKQLMKSLYDALSDGKIGIFESPTGTGKSLSIICGALKWLKDFQAKKKKDLEITINENVEDSCDDWFNDFLKKQEKTYKVIDAKKEYDSLLAHENRIKNLKANSAKKIYSCTEIPKHKRAKYDVNDNNENESVDDFAVDDPKSDNENANDEEKEKKPDILKIYFASRTHSQLAQFLREIKKSPYSDITVTTLGSRANLCINDTISRLKNLNLINEHCIELQKKKGESKKSCPFLKNLSDMEDMIISEVKDVEDIIYAGKELKACPYYASRNIIPDVELVVLPYNILLHKHTREAYKINLKDNIVIIDEAHNLVEAINSMYSAEISGLCLQQSLFQVEVYYRTYSNRFSQKNVKYIKLLLLVLKSFISFLKEKEAKDGSEPESKIVSCSEFITLSNVSNVNFFELVEYCNTSLIGHKLHGFTAARIAKGITPADDQIKSNVPLKSSTSSFLSQIKKMQTNVNEVKVLENKSTDNIQYKSSAFFTFIEFLRTLTFPTVDGRILYCKHSAMQKAFLKFLHLNPSSHFQDIVENARSVVLAGGTMQPVSEFTDLFINAGVSKERISYFACGHVIPTENLLAVGLGTGPCGNVLDFTYKSRKLPEMVKELGSIFINLCNSVKGGIVSFFPSYEYEEFVYTQLEKSKILESISKKKKIFREPKLSSDVDKVLTQYAKCIHMSKDTKTSNSNNGALLFSIVGGKMSEGINFSDDLGRCVIMVGLPYPNKFSIELKEKMLYLNKKHMPDGKMNAGDVYYNNLCMKAVNQSIGRAIRHKNDYAVIVLLDYRYNNNIVKDALPGWIQKSYNFYGKFGPAFFAIKKFYSSKNT